ncbi:extracellular solute-binding protein family 5 [Methanosalsum zhilinae DSM 4017]|uniref:Extracellular solute-binding protein family 5 n=1 Tax=Methanosalsum zhilinae (strain DSM 4017 / NBRC 107636 / OCM 62 / WeN5) TaxID=679901 RepID=F7XNJ0_METZD|nr:ABC transporter substrate-binding protein [Methanosalsum zhilinae]AEH60087.1 extracellular solute-binding protein family 5 [Methanosalsum zhilinae DSM 4017]
MKYSYRPIICSVFAVLLVVLCISGCLGDNGDTEQNGIEGSHESVLRIAQTFGPSHSLDPASDWVGWYVRQAGIYETLFSYDENMELVPELATGYEAIDEVTWEVRLRDDVKFHDGTPMDADAVVYSIERVMNPDNRRSSQYRFIEDVYAVDNYTVHIVTQKAYAPTIASLTDPIVSIVNPNVDNLAGNPSGTGPFIYSSFNPDIRLEVKKNENYWGDLARVDRVVIEYVSDPLTRALKIEGRDVHIADSIPPSEVARLDARPHLKMVNEETMRTAFMYVNTNKEPLDDVRVRQAISHAINREQVVNAALEGFGGSPAIGMFPSNFMWSANDEIEPYHHDTDKALELLSEAGIEDTTGDGRLEYNGEPFTIDIKTYSARPELRPAAEVMAIQLKSIGIESKAVTLESGALSADMNNGNYDLALYAWGIAPTGDPDYFLTQHFESGNTYAEWTGYSNPDVDEWLSIARTDPDENVRMEYYNKVQKQVHEDCPQLFVFYYKKTVGLADEVDGFVLYPNEITVLTNNIGI